MCETALVGHQAPRKVASIPGSARELGFRDAQVTRVPLLDVCDAILPVATRRTDVDGDTPPVLVGNRVNRCKTHSTDRTRNVRSWPTHRNTIRRAASAAIDESPVPNTRHTPLSGWPIGSHEFTFFGRFVPGPARLMARPIGRNDRAEHLTDWPASVVAESLGSAPTIPVCIRKRVSQERPSGSVDWCLPRQITSVPIDTDRRLGRGTCTGKRYWG
jgi:hypothetical protein